MSKLEALKNIPFSTELYIWGARMTGLGALRQCKAAGKRPIAFIDSDSAFSGAKVCSLPVYSPKELAEKLQNHNNALILIAVSLKEDEIRKQLVELGLGRVSTLSFQEESSPYYTVDILSSCNLKCASCPHSIEKHAVPKGSMNFETFRNVFDKILHETPELSHICLYSWGEPLIHPDISRIVEYVHQNNVAVALSSNLSIRFEDRLDALIQEDPDYLKVSVSGYYPEAYNNTHQGGDINLVKSNLYRLRYLIDKYKSSTLVDINYHLYRDNCGENLVKFRSLARELGFLISETYALVMPLERVIDHLDGVSDLHTKHLSNNLLVNIDEGIKAASKHKLPSNTCPFRENQININADLSVPICCTVFHRGDTVVAQNFLNVTVSEINAQKASSNICTRCSHLGLPEYNMGLNKVGWDEYAKEKEKCDVGDSINVERQPISIVTL